MTTRRNPWLALMGVLLVAGKHFISDATYRGLLYACGTVIVALGVLFVVIGLRTVTSARDAEAGEGTSTA